MLCSAQQGVPRTKMETIVSKFSSSDLDTVSDAFNMAIQVVVEVGKTRYQIEPFEYPKDALFEVLQVLFRQTGEQAEALDELLRLALESYGDIRFQCLDLFPKLLPSYHDDREHFEFVAARIVLLMGSIEVESNFRKTLVNLPPSITKKSPIKSKSSHRSEYSSCWLELLKLIPADALGVHKRVLSVLNDVVIPQMTRPQLLIDYLTDAYDNGGGIISLLALSSLFTLIQKHNLDYPDFFTKLYSLLDNRILHISYRRRFLRLLDLFMTSTMLPAYLVAAFVKRIARLALYAPAPSVQWVVPFIYNMLKVHPICRVLIHREEITNMECDPYLPDEKDPAKCRAMESCLWEVQSLTKHHWGSAARQAAIFTDRFTKPPFELGKFLDNSFTYEEIVENELEHLWSRRPPTNLDIPTSCFE